MTTAPPRPMCFAVMPFGLRKDPADPTLTVDFDAVWRALKEALTHAGYEAERADLELSGGFVHRAMYERLLVAELVVADLSFGNLNVAYEVGVRHGAGRARTILIAAKPYVDRPNGLPFDHRPLRVLTYAINADGSLPDASVAALQDALVKRIEEARAGLLPADNPILQVTGLAPSAGPSHEKTDVFMQRMKYVSDTARRISELVGQEGGEAVLDAIEQELITSTAYQEVQSIHTNLLALFIAWREKKRYDRMEALYEHLPAELKRTPVVMEQLALARNRMAEAAAKRGDAKQAQRLRSSALATAAEISPERWTSETWGIVGRIHKGAYDAASDELEAKAALGKAIESYESGFIADPRDYFPGVNAVTLRAIRNRSEDVERLKKLLPAVQFSVERAPPPKADKQEDAYWQAATRMELACIERNWPVAENSLLELLGLKHAPWMQSWMYETTANNLALIRKARASEPETVKSLEAFEARLRAAKS